MGSEADGDGDVEMAVANGGGSSGRESPGGIEWRAVGAAVQRTSSSKSGSKPLSGGGRGEGDAQRGSTPTDSGEAFCADRLEMPISALQRLLQQVRDKIT